MYLAYKKWAKYKYQNLVNALYLQAYENFTIYATCQECGTVNEALGVRLWLKFNKIGQEKNCELALCLLHRHVLNV